MNVLCQFENLCFENNALKMAFVSTHAFLKSGPETVHDLSQHSEYSEPERSGFCTGGSEDRCEEFFARTWELFQEWLRVARQIDADFSQMPL
jgi:hypothetical protein